MGWTVGKKAQRPLTLVKLYLPVCWGFGSSLSGPPSWRRFVDDAPSPPDKVTCKTLRTLVTKADYRRRGLPDKRHHCYTRPAHDAQRGPASSRFYWLSA